jgi:hypothetical protein
MINYIGPGDSVPYMSQYDTRVEAAWQSKFCGIVSLYMVVRYWYEQRHKNPPGLEEISDYALKLGGFNQEEGWDHTKLADTARHFKCDALARSWLCRQNDMDIMFNQNRLRNEREAAYYQQQVYAEFMYSLFCFLNDQIPILLSVKPKFGPANSNHVIVVTGIDSYRDHLLVHDPQHMAHEGENIAVTTKKLLQFSNFNAIVVYDETVRA